MAVHAERYELGELLGAGGMARVVAAYDRVLQRDVAIKLINDAHAGDPVSRERMLREARAAAGLHHPNTVTVFDAGEAEGRPYLVMELVAGRTLADRLADGRLPVDETVRIADGALAGLHAAHQRGLVHRDIKPSNILLPATGGVKLADFGVAKVLAETSAALTGSGQILGTPRYLAPEQTKGEPASPASDLYSLGVVLYHCLAGVLPFTADTPIEEALAHQRQPVPPLAGTAPHVPARLAAVVERALAKGPADRFPDAPAMRHALDAAMSTPGVPGVDTPAAHRPTPAIQRLARGHAHGAPAAGARATGAPASGAPASSMPATGSTDDRRATRVLQVPHGPGGPEVAAGPPTGRRRPQESSTGALGTRRWVWLSMGSIASVMALVVLAAVATSGDERPDEESRDAPAATETDGADEPDTLTGDAGEQPDGPDTQEIADPENTGAPTNLSALVAELSSAPQAAGDKGNQLRKKLRELQEERDYRKRAEKARDLRDKVASWIDDGKLDTRWGELTLAVL